MRDTIESFGDFFYAMRNDWQMNVMPGLHANAIRQVERSADVLFAEVNVTIREMARIPIARNLAPEMIPEICSCVCGKYSAMQQVVTI